MAQRSEDAEIVVVDDGSTDGSAAAAAREDASVVLHRPPMRLGTVLARNYGAQMSRGETLVFGDAHVDVPPSLGAAAARTASVTWSRGGRPRNLDDGAAGREGLWPALPRCGVELRVGSAAKDGILTPVPILGAGFMAMLRAVFDALGGFDRSLVMYGMEGPDLCFRLWTFGYSCILVPTVEVAHVLRDDHPFQEWDHFLHNVLRFGVVHFSHPRLERLIESHARDPALPTALARVLTSDARSRRREVHARRVRNDDWYFGAVGAQQHGRPLGE